MSNTEKIKGILTKLSRGETVKDSEVTVISQAIESNENQSFQFGEYVVNIGKGDGIKIGNQYIYQGNNGSEPILESLGKALHDFFANQDPSNIPPTDLKNAVNKFLSDIENKFQYIKLFHDREREVPLTDQYIPIQVTLERIYKEKLNENFGSYGESEEEIKRIYAAKGDKYERKQEDWQEAKKEHQIIMVLADPGMGKSTLLRIEALTLAREEKKKLSGNDFENLAEEDIAKIIASIQIPLYLRLSDLAEESGNIADIILKFIKRDYPSSREEIRR